MDSLILLVVFVFGLVIGSFLNVVIFRLGTEDDIINSRSKCLACGHQLAWYDLFPVISFLSLGGKCRYCRKKISWQYPLVEIATGALFVALFYTVFLGYNFVFLNVFNFLSLLFIFSALVVIFVFDLKQYIIPDEVIFPAIAVAFLALMVKVIFSSSVLDFSLFANFFGAALLAGGFFLFLVVVTRGEGMGGGDVKLGFLMGLVLGFPKILLALFFAFISGALVGVFLMALGKKKMKSMLPFGPFLICGFLLSFFWGSEIISWYWEKFLF